MAIIKPGAVVSGISGTIGGVNFSMNGATIQARNKAAKVKTETKNAIMARARHVNSMRAWAELTNDEKKAWETAARTTKRQNRLGETKATSGRNLFVQYQNIYQNIGFGLWPEIPIYNAIGGLLEVNIEFDDENYWVSWEKLAAIGLNVVLFYGKAHGSKTRKAPGGLTYLTYEIPGQPDAINLYDIWNDRIGELRPGELFTVGIRTLYVGSTFSSLSEYQGKREG